MKYTIRIHSDKTDLIRQVDGYVLAKCLLKHYLTTCDQFEWTQYYSIEATGSKNVEYLRDSIFLNESIIPITRSNNPKCTRYSNKSNQYLTWLHQHGYSTHYWNDPNNKLGDRIEILEKYIVFGDDKELKQFTRYDYAAQYVYYMMKKQIYGKDWTKLYSEFTIKDTTDGKIYDEIMVMKYLKENTISIF